MNKLYNKFLRLTENEKINEQKFIARMAVSVLSMLICVVMLCGTTYAYFTTTATSSVDIIRASTYFEEVEVEPITALAIDGAGVYISRENAAEMHRFVLSAAGTAENGYFKIIVNGTDIYCTDIVKPGEQFVLVFISNPGDTIEFEAIWGEFGKGEITGTQEEPFIIDIAGPDVLIEEEIAASQYTIHTVAEGETLQSIAELYGITVEEICEYNDILASMLISAGQQIAIPVVEKTEQETIPPQQEETPAEESSEETEDEVTEDEESEESKAEDTSSDSTEQPDSTPTDSTAPDENQEESTTDEGQAETTPDSTPDEVPGNEQQDVADSNNSDISTETDQQQETAQDSSTDTDSTAE